MEKGVPEVEILLPEREIQSEQMREIVVHLLDSRSTAARRDPRQHIPDRITGHEARDHPINGHRKKKGKQINEYLSPEVPFHANSSLLEIYKYRPSQPEKKGR
jgi:hypothetical protein